MIYYLLFLRNGSWTARCVNTAHDTANEFFQNNNEITLPGEQGRLFSFWLGADGDPN